MTHDMFEGRFGVLISEYMMSVYDGTKEQRRDVMSDITVQCAKAMATVLTSISPEARTNMMAKFSKASMAMADETRKAVDAAVAEAGSAEQLLELMGAKRGSSR